MLKKHTPLLLLVSFLAILTATTSFWQMRGAKAAANSETTFGIVGLTPGQVLRFNVVDIDRPSSRVRLEFDIYELGGPDTFPQGSSAARTNNLRFVRRESCSAQLRPLESVSCDLTAREASFVNTRLVADEQSSPEPHLVPTLEVQEAGRTIFIHPGAAKGFNPQPDPPAGITN